MWFSDTVRKASNQKVMIHSQIANILAESLSLSQAAPRLLEALCRELGWDESAVWQLDTMGQVLRPLVVWHRPDDVLLADFAAATCDMTMGQGVGLPGRVWAQRDVVWVKDVRVETNFPRAAFAAHAGLSSAFAFPLIAGGQFVGVLEAFTRQTLEPDANIIELGRTLATQIGYFLLRQIGLSSQARLAAIVRDSDDAILAKDLNGILLDWNPAAERLYGYTRDEVIGKSVLIIFPPERKHQLQSIMARIARGEKIDHFDTVRLRKDGTRVDVSVTISPLRDETGKVVGASVVARNVTERKRVEQEIRFKSNLLDTVEQAVIATDLDGTITYWNHFAEKLYGWPADQVIGQNIIEVTPTDASREQALEIMEQVRRGQSWSGELLVKRRDGTSFPAQVTDSPVYDLEGTLVGIVGVSSDISARQAAEQALQLSARRQAVLYQLTDQLQRTQSLQDIYDASLDAILEALQCDRASILFFDDAGVMRFVSWRGLSEAYRHATSGHSPWKPDSKNPEPILMNDVEAADLDEPLRATIRNEGIGALAFIPLVNDGKVIGKFMVYYNVPHSFSSKERELALLIARQLAFAVARHNTEQALGESENRLRLATQSGAIGIWDFDLVTQTRNWSPQGKAIYGLAPDDYLDYDRQLALIHPDDRATVEAMVRAFRDQGTIRRLQLEHRIVRPDSAVRWVSVRGEAIYNGGSLPERLVGTIVDITESKETEQKLRASEQRFQMLADGSPVLLWVNGLNGAEFVNREYLDFLGVESQVDVAGYDWSQFVHPDDRASYLSAYLRAFEQQSFFEKEFRFRRHDGQYRWMRSTATPRRAQDGTFQGFVGASVDITERKLAEQALQESQDRLRLMIEFMPNAVLMVNRAGSITVANSQAEQLFGYTREELVGLTVEKLVPEPFRRRHGAYREGFFAAPQVRKMGMGRDLALLRKDGTQVPVEIGLNPITTAEGEFALLSIIDITERKQVEKRIRASEARYRTIFETATVSLWEEDFTVVREMLNQVRANDVTDIRQYLTEHPEFVRAAAQKAVVNDVNPETLRMLGAKTREELLGALDRGFTPDSLPIFADELAVIANGGGYFQAEVPARTLQGERREFFLSVTFPPPDQQIDRVLVSVIDITERKQAERSKDFLDDATSRLNASLDYDATLRTIAQLAVPALGDWCAVHALTEDGMIRRLAFVHRDAEKIQAITARPQQYALDKNANHLVSYVIRTGQVEFLNEVPPTVLHEAARDAEHLKSLQLLGLEAYICIPLQARGRILGAVTFALSDADKKYTANDVELAQELVRRASLAADNAWLYQESQAAQARLQLVAETSSEIITSLDHETRMERLARLVVARFAEWCVINLVADDGSIRLATLAHVQPEKEAIIREWAAQQPLDPDAEHGTPQVIRSGKAEWVTDVAMNPTARDYRIVVERLRLKSYMIVPLIARGRTFGAITFSNPDTARRFSFQDLLTGEEIGRRAAVALDNATLFMQEQAAREEIEENSIRISALQNVTAALGSALTATQAAQIALEQSIAALGAHAGSVWLLSEDGHTLEPIHGFGYEPEIVEAWRNVTIHTRAPMPEAVVTGVPILLSGAQMLRDKYPEVFERQRGLIGNAWAAIPLILKGRVLGVVGLTFLDEREFDERDEAFMNALAQQTAQAIDRTRLYEAEQQARALAEQNTARISALQRVTAALSAALTHAEIADITLNLGIPAVDARGGSIALLTHDGEDLEVLGTFGYQANNTNHWKRFPARLATPMGDVLHSRELLYLSSQDLATRYPQIGVAESLWGSQITLPLVANDQAIGALHCSFEKEKQVSAADIQFLTALAQQCAQALDRARLYQAEREARHAAEHEQQRSELLATISAELAASLNVSETLQRMTHAMVPAFADYAVVDIVNDQELQPIAVAHFDPAQETLTWELVSSYHPRVDDPDSPSGRVARNGELAFYPELPAPEFRTHLPTERATELFDGLQIRSLMILPLIVRGRVFGVMNVGYTTSERTYTRADVNFGQEIARRAAIALENAELYQAQERARARAEENAARIGALQRVTAALTTALTPDEVARAVLELGIVPLGASSGALALLSQDAQTIQLLRSVSYAQETLEPWLQIPADAPVPIADAIRTGEILAFSTLEDALARYPHIPFGTTGNHAWLVVPLAVNERRLGGLWMSYGKEHNFSDADIAFARGLAQQCAQALERARLYESERSARQTAERAAQRSEWLTEASHVLSRSLDYKQTLSELAQLVVSELADWCTIDMAKGDGTAEQLVLAHQDPVRLQWAKDFSEEIKQYFEPDWEAPRGLPAVLRTGKAEIYYDIPDELLQQAAKNEVQLQILRSIGYSSVMIVPLNAQGKTLGAITMVNTDSQRHFTDDDLALAELFAGRAAVAIENARLYQEKEQLNAELEERVRERTAQLSRAYQELSGEVGERRRAQETTGALLRISNKLNSTLDVQESLDILIQEAITLMGARVGFAGLRTPRGMEIVRYYENGERVPVEHTWPPGKGMPGWVLEHAAPYLTNDAPNDPIILHELPFNRDVKCALCTPILNPQNQVVGFFEVRDRISQEPFAPADADFLMALSPIASIALENARAYQKISEAESAVQESYAQLRALAARLQTIREEERTDIARELHDELGQSLTALKMDLAALIARLPKRNKLLRERATSMTEQIDQTIKVVRRMSSQLRPGMLDDLGLGPSIEWYAQEFQTRTGIVVETNIIEQELALNHTQATALYRIFQETLTNVARHANATRVQATLNLEGDELVLTVSDNGRGLDLSQVRGKRSLGLLGMRERAEMIQGTLSLEGEPGKGTTVAVRVPL